MHVFFEQYAHVNHCCKRNPSFVEATHVLNEWQDIFIQKHEVEMSRVWL